MEDLPKIWQKCEKVLVNVAESIGKYLAKIYLFFIKQLVKLTIKFHGTIDEHLTVLPGNEQDLGHENIVKTYLFYQEQSANAEKL